MLGEIRKHGVIKAFRRNSMLLSVKLRNRLEELLGPDTMHPVAYRGCHVCLTLYQAGIFSELNNALAKQKIDA